MGPGTITGSVKDPRDNAISGATVSVEGQSASTNTDASGNFILTGVNPGFVYLSVTSPSANFLNGGTRRGTYVPPQGLQ